MFVLWLLSPILSTFAVMFSVDSRKSVILCMSKLIAFVGSARTGHCLACLLYQLLDCIVD